MKKLYETDSYLKEWESTVLSCEEADGSFFISLDASAFFPEEGGQYADTGELFYEGRGIKLLDGKLINGEVVYKVSDELPVGARVKCRLNFEERFSRMQQHSGEHIVVGLIHNLYGFDNVGFHLSDDKPVTLDINGELTGEQLADIENRANQVVFSNLPITAAFPDKTMLRSIDYRSKIEIEGQVRLIYIGDVLAPIDICACCAPHVASTAEIGLIKIVNYEKYKGGMRISILCGSRALADYREKQDILNNLVQTMSVKTAGLVASVDNLKKDNLELRNKLNIVNEKLLFMSLPKKGEEENFCVITDGDISPVVMKNVFNELAERCSGYVGVFVGDDSSGYRFNAGSIHKDIAELIGQFRSKLGAKCGGNGSMFTGKVLATREAIELLYKSLEVSDGIR